ncbi:MAG: hypothetical protein KKG95_01025, partial [Candidatus Omnitrophica bacterium]|nr:hypothetical protein [Candidatus Omnitrophota bacterium]
MERASAFKSGLVYVTYVTQAWKEVWDNLIQGEAVTVTSNIGTLANLAVAIQSIRSTATTATNAILMLDKDDTAATLEAELDWTDGSGTTTSATFLNTDIVTAAVISYVKKPSSGFLYNNFVEEETATLDAYSGVTYQLTDYPVLMWSYAGQIPINAQTTQVIINQGGTMGSGEGYILWDQPSGLTGTTTYETSYVAAATNQATAMTTGTYIKGKTSDIPFLVPLEVQ